MKERPILFSAPMVRAILSGRKTQTRRIVKQKHLPFLENILGNFLDGKWNQRPLPYGKTGDRLWVRETFAHDFEHNRYFYKADCDNDGTVPHLINGSGIGGGIGNARIQKWKPSIHMPRLASRILLEVVNVRVERLQDISEDDAKAEGSDVRDYLGRILLDQSSNQGCYKWGFRTAWESINGQGSWDLNPFVWVVEFRTLEISRAAS